MTQEMKWVVLWATIGLVFISLIGVGVLLENQQESNDMRACVDAGHSWVQQHGDYYNCE